MSHLDETQLHRDHLADHLRERDREREPVRRRRAGRDLAGRNAFYAGLADPDRYRPVPARAPTPQADAVLAAAARACDADPLGVYCLLICALAVHCQQAVNPTAMLGDVAAQFRALAGASRRYDARRAAAARATATTTTTTTGVPL